MQKRGLKTATEMTCEPERFTIGEEIAVARRPQLPKPLPPPPKPPPLSPLPKPLTDPALPSRDLEGVTQQATSQHWAGGTHH